MVPTNVNRIKILPPPSNPLQPEPWCGKHLNEHEVPLKNVYNYANKKDTNDKTPMCRVAELARYNKLKHEYILLDEDGPAHKKKFTVKLVLCDGEEFEGSGASIKKAQQSAAEVAMENSKLPRPPTKIKKQRKDASNPTMLLNHVANQLGLTVHYEDEIQQVKNGRYPLLPPPQQQRQMRVAQDVRNIPFMPPPPFPLLRMPQFPHQGFYQSPPSYSPRNQYHIPHPSSPHFAMMTAPPNTPSPLPSNQGGQQQMPMMQQQPFQAHPPPPRSLLSSDLITQPPPFMNGGLIRLQSSFKTKIKLSDGSEHFGEGSTKFDARCNSATKALTHLKPQLTELEAKMTKLKMKKSSESSISSSSSESSTTSSIIDDNKENDTATTEGNETEAIEGVVVDVTEIVGIEGEGSRRNRQKSVVSQIHEYALRLKMNVEFEVLQESGEPHKRKYILRCQLSAVGKNPIIADGEGTSKKAAKQEACKKMLEKLQGIETDPVYLASMILQTNKKTAASLAPKEPKRKTIIKDLKMDPLYGHHINPISRLIQITQSKKEPIFRLVREQGQNRYKEFTFEITCRGITLTGSGPNKKLAKRAAAEAMLEHIGYVKPMPQPGKSLLKKRSLDSTTSPISGNGTSPTTTMTMSMSTSVDIGVFDPNEFTNNEVFSHSAPTTPEAPIPQHQQSRNLPISLETFADVDNSLKDSTQAPSTTTTSPPLDIINQAEIISPKSPSKVSAVSFSEGQDDASMSQQSEPMMRKRRVTFSNQVSACPPPEDSKYPEASIAPLKSEVVIVSKLKKRGKDSKKSLTLEEKSAVAQMCRFFFTYHLAEDEHKGYVSRDNDAGQFQIPSLENGWLGPIIKTAKEQLEALATTFKFTVAYSDFPKTENSMDSQNFSLVTLGLEKPIVCHGSGDSDEIAHNNAAFNALKQLAILDSGISQQQQTPTNIIATTAAPNGMVGIAHPSNNPQSSPIIAAGTGTTTSTTMGSIIPGSLPAALSLL